jgi:hypothetical protein
MKKFSNSAGIFTLRITIAVALASMSVFLATFAHAIGDRGPSEPLHPTARACVEVPTEVINRSEKRASERKDCDPQIAFTRANNQSQINAKDAIAPFCRQITRQQAIQICQAAGDRRGTIPRSGGGRIDAVLPILPSNPKVSAILRNVPSETETSTEPADANHGWCVLNNGRVTVKKVRTRATCGVDCPP